MFAVGPAVRTTLGRTVTNLENKGIKVVKRGVPVLVPITYYHFA